MSKANAACLIALALALLSFGADARSDCEEARRLPADADEESRRIVCEIPEAYRYEVGLAEFVGQMIRLHDSAAWLTTDALQEIKAFDGQQGKGRGWLTLGNGEDIEVRYFFEHDGRTAAVASATLDTRAFKARDARKLSPAEPMSEREQRLMRARMLALATDGLMVCTNHPPNTVVIEADEDGRKEIQVFVMSAWVSDAETPLGGYHMFRVSEDGNTVISHFSQTRACPLGRGSQSRETAALAVTHLTSKAPTMFHVFMSLQYRKPLYVTTTQNGMLWRVEKGRVFLVNDKEPKANADRAGARTTSTGT
ncbi:hypothetical protein [Lysobacter niastensis]|uniref:META domain-containing protein n=1 Tax=Lysobacter niastensis TaxID=380629 RepID=A0ABS0B6N3_9GAMM|nr:hypothetical protein [Lysobacter niastensis]MBF6024533.1 hypothetical protein [Lysobacter niastensis]